VLLLSSHRQLQVGMHPLLTCAQPAAATAVTVIDPVLCTPLQATMVTSPKLCRSMWMVQRSFQSRLTLLEAMVSSRAAMCAEQGPAAKLHLSTTAKLRGAQRMCRQLSLHCAVVTCHHCSTSSAQLPFWHACNRACLVGNASLLT
jgi:hypothetical protein